MIRFLFLALIALSSCAPVYVPNLRNSPMFTKAGEFQASVQFGNGIEAQSAFAIVNGLGVMANYSYIDARELDNEDDFIRHRFFEGGIGYFSNKQDSFFEVFAGYGRGQGTTYESYEFFGPQSTAATGQYERYFLQPAVGMNKSDFQFSFSPRVSMVDFYEFSNEFIRTEVNEEPRFFLEPAFIGRYNFAQNHMFFTFQAGASLGMSEDIYFDRRTFQLAAGLGFRLGGAKQLVSRL